MASVGRVRARAALFLLVISSAFLSSACFLQLVAITVGFSPGGYPYYETEYTVTTGASSLVANCDNEEVGAGFEWTVGCTYVITDTDGFLFEITSTFDLVAEFGLLGVLVDPLVLQLPESVQVGLATATGGSLPVPLVVTHTQSFQAGPDRTVNAEPGMKFVILELPDSVAASIDAQDPQQGSPLDFQLTLTSATIDFPVKTMFTVRIDAPDVDYYLPTLPCTADFSEVPAATVSFGLAQSSDEALAQLVAEYAGMTCDGKVYDLRDTPDPPSQGSHRLFLAAVASD